jgi:hypothetical protein
MLARRREFRIAADVVIALLGKNTRIHKGLGHAHWRATKA